jgi:hypothetical protein
MQRDSRFAPSSPLDSLRRVTATSRDGGRNNLQAAFVPRLHVGLVRDVASRMEDRPRVAGEEGERGARVTSVAGNIGSSVVFGRVASCCSDNARDGDLIPSAGCSQCIAFAPSRSPKVCRIFEFGVFKPASNASVDEQILERLLVGQMFPSCECSGESCEDRSPSPNS